VNYPYRCFFSILLYFPIFLSNFIIFTNKNEDDNNKEKAHEKQEIPKDEK
jgi:hypothetical protein